MNRPNYPLDLPVHDAAYFIKQDKMLMLLKLARFSLVNVYGALPYSPTVSFIDEFLDGEEND